MRWANLSRRSKVAAIAAALLAAAFVPECPNSVPDRPSAESFAWGQDEAWKALEEGFVRSRAAGCSPQLETRRQEIRELADSMGDAGPEHNGWTLLETQFFHLAADSGGCPEQLGELIELRRHIRIAAKNASQRWEKSRPARDRLYRLLYGTRTAIEELLLQAPHTEAPALSLGREVESSTPSIDIEGVQIHSGDILLSRGGAPTSAFIARGNDYPGNFSHVALVHVDENAGAASVIEAHIERGVVIATAEQYFADKKLRILVLRLRADHPHVRAVPMAPHLAAQAALARVESGHIPYDFAMDFNDDEEQFCSEVASAAYRDEGVILWDTLSTFSTPGLARWMAALGVENLETQAPSDLEYDPQLQVVAEWHDPATLFDDHVDNAVIDAMIEQAEAGASLAHAWHLLPVARLAKAYSVALNLAGNEGPIPEGMSATVALRATWLEDRHKAIKQQVLEAAERFESDHGYAPPYWELVALAREAAAG